MTKLDYKNKPEEIIQIIENNNVDFVRFDEDKMSFYTNIFRKDNMLTKLINLPGTSYRLLNVEQKEGDSDYVYQTSKMKITSSHIKNNRVSNIVPAKDVLEYINKNNNVESLYEDLKEKMQVRAGDFKVPRTVENIKTISNHPDKEYNFLYIDDFDKKNELQFATLGGHGGRSGPHYYPKFYNFKKNSWDHVYLFNNKMSQNCRSQSAYAMQDLFKENGSLSANAITSKIDKETKENDNNELIQSLLQIQKSLILNDVKFLNTNHEVKIVISINKKYESRESISENIDEIMEYAKKELLNPKKSKKAKMSQ